MATQIYPGVFTPTQKNFEVQAQTKAKRYLDTYTDAKYEAWELSLAQAEKKLAQEMSLFEAKQKAKLDMLQQLNDRQMLYEKQLQDLTDAKLSADEKEQVFNANAENDQKSLEYKELSTNARADAAGKNRASRSNAYYDSKQGTGTIKDDGWTAHKAEASGSAQTTTAQLFQDGVKTVKRRSTDVETGNAIAKAWEPVRATSDVPYIETGAVAAINDRIGAGSLTKEEVLKVAKMSKEEANKLGYSQGYWEMVRMWNVKTKGGTNTSGGGSGKGTGRAVATPVVAPEPYDPSLIGLSTLPADEREAYILDQLAALKYERDAIQYELDAMQDPNSDVIGEARGIYKEKFVRPDAKITQAQLNYLPKFIAKGLRELPLTATAAEKAQAEEQATKIWATWVATGKLPTSTKVPMGNELVDSEAGVDLRPTRSTGSTEAASQQAASTGDSSQSVQSVQPTQAQPVQGTPTEPTEVIDLTGSGTTGGAANTPAPVTTPVTMNPEVKAILRELGIEPDADVARLGPQPNLSNVQPVPSTYNVDDSNIDPRITGTAQPVQPRVVAPQATTVATPVSTQSTQPVQGTQPQMPPASPISSPVAPQVVAPSQFSGTQPQPATGSGTSVQPQGTGTSRGSVLGQSILNSMGSVPASGTVKGVAPAVPSLSAGVGNSPVSVPNAMGGVPDASTVKGVEASVPPLSMRSGKTLPSLPVQTKVPEAGKSAKSVYVPAKAVMRALAGDSDTLDLTGFMESEMNAPDKDIEYGDNTDALDELSGEGIILGTDRKVIDGMYEDEVQYKQTPEMIEKSNTKLLPIDEEDVKEVIKKNDMGGATNKTIDTTLKTEAVLAGRQLAGRPKKLERITLNTDYGMFTKKLWDMNKSSDTPKTVNELRGELAKVYMSDPVKQNKAVTTLYAIDMAANDMSKQRLV